VHDAARPCLASKWVDALFEKVTQTGAAILAEPVTATVKRGDDKSRIVETIPRDNLWLAQTPQVFKKQWLTEAHSKFGHLNVTDDAQLMEHLGHPVSLVPSSPMNLKITTKEDLKLAEQVLKALPKAKGFPF
jgi:2-C-methyl-D-erythritol 4-phosphate cytidylyltransferase